MINIWKQNVLRFQKYNLGDDNIEEVYTIRLAGKSDVPPEVENEILRKKSHRERNRQLNEEIDELYRKMDQSFRHKKV